MNCPDHLPTHETRITTHSPAETELLGGRLGAMLGGGIVVCLAGELGAGKTWFTRGLARGWGSEFAATSPTFTLINLYPHAADDRRFYHADAYRLADAGDAMTTGIEDVFDVSDVIVIEWPERVQNILPTERLWVSIERAGEGSRDFHFMACGAAAVEALAALESGSA